MIDTHCHIDLFSDPIQVATEADMLGISTICMTNLPSHFKMGYKHLQGYKKIRLALGLHPLYADLHNEELPLFKKYVDNTSYIGEIGLDFSKEGIVKKDIQINSLNEILTILQGKHKILSLHSRKAEKSLLDLLVKYRIKSAIFHWYTGPLNLVNSIVSEGYFFSINTAMIKSKAGQEVIKQIPMNYILTESDGPFIQTNGRPAKPSDTKLVLEYLSKKLNLSIAEVDNIISQNFKRLLSTLNT